MYFTTLLIPRPPLNPSDPSSFYDPSPPALPLWPFPLILPPRHHPSHPSLSPLSLRAVPGIYYQEGAVEVMTVYFEDSRVNSGIANMGIRKALWPMVSGGGGAA